MAEHQSEDKVSLSKDKLEINIDPALRDWEYDGDGVKRYKDTFKLVEE